ncbi:MAG TPA: Wzz/FepE/Etk N-terminal domain-containing protein [bacterium]|nr:Wzz/FepE/Etk N-terminal domain-containing protein [bacterium]HQG47169.1 Wzz/FepE/Etk N-terminal domain-containing protein [bacterium]HQI48307.1 Wzz/FepE/Etk N-terminal domain-containing protein [bacterium]HQJ64197.1 Wzz/FepE/Etk N-terminal domain-containing protein [bacterium]
MADKDQIVEIHLLDYLLVITRWRWRIVRNTVLVAAGALLLAFLLPRRYVAVTTLLPPPEQQSSAMAGLLSDIKVPGIALPEQSTTSDIFLEMLRSRSVGERVLQRRFAVKGDSLPLLRILGARNIESGLQKMSKRAVFVLSKKSVMTISVEMGNPALAADVANAYVEELDRVNREKSVSRAKNSRLYIENQLRETQQHLAAITRQLAEYQRGRRAISLEEQVKAAITQSGEVKGQIIAKEIGLNVMLQSMKPENPLVVRARQELEGLKRKYNDLQVGARGEPPNDLFMPTAAVPELGVQLAELVREVKIQETVWELLNSQYYQARIEEARDTPTVQVLDRAVPPRWPSSPRKKVLAAVLGILAGLGTIFYAFILEYAGQLDRRPAEKARWQEFFAAWHEDGETVRHWLRRRRR